MDYHVRDSEHNKEEHIMRTILTMVYENRTFVTDESALAAIKQDLIKMIRSATKEENILREKGRE